VGEGGRALDAAGLTRNGRGTSLLRGLKNKRISRFTMRATRAY
jgi:hypothetical protein